MLLKGEDVAEAEARIPELIESASESEDSATEQTAKKKKKKKRKKKKKSSFMATALVDPFQEEMLLNAAKEEGVNEMLIRKFSDPRLVWSTASSMDPPMEGVVKSYPPSDVLACSLLSALVSQNEASTLGFASTELHPPPLEPLAIEGATVLGVYIQRQKDRDRLYTEACETLTFLSSELG